MKSNKDKILESSLKLFNEKGWVNVRLQHISDEAIVSVGNLAYHFNNKGAILLTLYQSLTEQQKSLLAAFKVVPLFDEIDKLIRRTFQLQQAYIFFYLDTLEIVRANDEIAAAHAQHISWQIAQLKTMLDFNMARGALLKVDNENQLEQLAEQIWMTLDFWRSTQSVKGKKSFNEQEYCDAIWNLLIPYFTEMGKREYGQMREKPYDFYF
jgi:AcrR family transcriptional regulator